MADLRRAAEADYAGRIRRFRAHLGLSQAQLAQSLGVSVASIIRWENARTRPSALAWSQIVRAEAIGSSTTEAVSAEAAEPGFRAPRTLTPAGDAGQTRLGAFVGRERELSILRSALDTLLAGAGGVVLLAGEAGIGKTRTVQEFAGAARAQGAAVLWGRCDEDECTLPHAPWEDILSQYVRTRNPTHLRAELGQDAAILSQLVPEVKAWLPEFPPALLDPNEARLRLYRAITRVLLGAAARQPLILVLDDVHWADPASLGLLRHVARSAGQAPLLLLCLYRAGESPAAASLAQDLAEVSREQLYRHLPLSRLTANESSALLAQLCGAPVGPAVADAIYAETGGNPFFIEGLVRDLQEEGRDLLPPSEGVAAWRVPEDVRQAIGKRLSRLSPETRRMLGVAAAFVGGFEFAVLQSLLGFSEDAVLDCLEEALKAGMIRAFSDQEEKYEFVHALVRHSLYDGLSPSRRIRLHRRLAEALARIYAGREFDVAAELAHQYHRSMALPGASAAIPLVLAMAERARTSYGHEQAILFLRIARDLAAESTPAVQSEILSKLAIAEAQALMLADAQATVQAALAALNASEATAHSIAVFLTEAASVFRDAGAERVSWEPLVRQGLELTAERHDLTWARLALLLDRFEVVASGAVRAVRRLDLEPEAIAIARVEGDEADYAATLELVDPRSRAETTALFSLVQTWQQPAAMIWALNVAAHDLLARHGSFGEASGRYRELFAIGERCGSILGQVWALVHQGICQIALGELAEAQATRKHAIELVNRLPQTHRLQLAVSWLDFSLAYCLEGDWPALAAALSGWLSDPRPILRMPALVAQAILACVRAGRPRDARRFLRALAPILEAAEPSLFLLNSAVVVAAGAVWELAAVEFAGSYHRLALRLMEAEIGDPPLGSLSLTVARMAALAGDSDVAAEQFARARIELDSSGQRPLRAILDLDEAAALVRRGSTDDPRVDGLLSDALMRFRRLGMDAWGQRVLELEALIARTCLAESGLDYPDGLTPREAEVLRLIASGRTNREIAETLVVTLPTVERHISNLYSKISARGKADATAYALRHGLVIADAP